MSNFGVFCPNMNIGVPWDFGLVCLDHKKFANHCSRLMCKGSRLWVPSRQTGSTLSSEAWQLILLLFVSAISGQRSRAFFSTSSSLYWYQTVVLSPSQMNLNWLLDELVGPTEIHSICKKGKHPGGWILHQYRLLNTHNVTVCTIFMCDVTLPCQFSSISRGLSATVSRFYHIQHLCGRAWGMSHESHLSGINTVFWVSDWDIINLIGTINGGGGVLLHHAKHGHLSKFHYDSCSLNSNCHD